MNPLKPDAGLLAKLGSIVVHTAELLSPGAHMLDRLALDALSTDPDVVAWLAAMDKLALIPKPRPPKEPKPPKPERAVCLPHGVCIECNRVFPLNAKGRIPAHSEGPKGRRRACDGGGKRSRQGCRATRDDGDCREPKACPQIRDGEPAKTGRHCPLDRDYEDDV